MFVIFRCLLNFSDVFINPKRFCINNCDVPEILKSEIDTSVTTINNQLRKLFFFFGVWIILAIFYRDFDINSIMWDVFLFVTILNIIAIFMYTNLKMDILSICQNLLLYNRFDECLNMLDTHIKNSPTQFGLKICKLTTLLCCGSIEEYEKYYREICSLKNFSYSKYSSNAKNGYNVFLYLTELKTECCDSYSLKYEFGEILDVITCFKRDYNSYDMIIQANNVMSSQNVFYKCIGALLLAEIYSLRKDLISQQQYIEKAFEYSPSEEVTQCIRKHVDAMNNQIV